MSFITIFKVYYVSCILDPSTTSGSVVSVPVSSLFTFCRRGVLVPTCLLRNRRHQNRPAKTQLRRAYSSDHTSACCPRPMGWDGWEMGDGLPYPPIASTRRAFGFAVGVLGRSLARSLSYAHMCSRIKAPAPAPAEPSRTEPSRHIFPRNTLPALTATCCSTCRLLGRRIGGRGSPGWVGRHGERE